MALEIQLAGFCFDADDWRDYDDETRAVLLDAVKPENDFWGGSPGFAGRGAEAEPEEPFGDEEPTLIRARARGGA